ncbi:MAG: hypothetical protein VX841_12040 [Pseudomonadota bacterium]|nr:hypothetical protein [Pseudomonadota bacterium]
MKIYQNLLIFTLLLVLVGCKTPYQRQSAMNPVIGGYADYRTAENIFTVSFEGNKNTPSHFIENALLYRCAELSLENGFDYFLVIDSSEEIKTGTSVLPATVLAESSTTTNYVANSSSSYQSMNATVMPPQVITWSNKTASVKIVTYKQRPNAKGVYDSREIIKYLGPSIDPK